MRYLLGTPMVPESFDKERWDYLYYFKRGRVHRAQERHLIVWFKDDKVAKFERNNVPEAPPVAPGGGARGAGGPGGGGGARAGAPGAGRARAAGQRAAGGGPGPA